MIFAAQHRAESLTHNIESRQNGGRNGNPIFNTHRDWKYLPVAGDIRDTRGCTVRLTETKLEKPDNGESRVQKVREGFKF